MQQITTVFRDSTHCQCVSANVYTLYTMAEASSDNILKFVRHFDRFAHSATGRIACVIITGASTTPPDHGDRRRVAEVMAKHASKLSALAVVLQADGFKGSIIRSVVSGIFILPNPGYPTKIFAKPGECVDWVANQIHSSPGSIEATIDHTIKLMS